MKNPQLEMKNADRVIILRQSRRISFVRYFTSFSITFCIIFNFTFLIFNYLYAGNEGTATATFLRLEQGARPLGMGGAFVAIADSADGIYYNPAGIAQLIKKEVSFTYSSLYQDISSSFLSLAIPTEKYGSFGVGITYLTVGGIEKADTSGNLLGKMDIYNLAVAFYYAKKLGMVSVGGGLKLIQQDYDVASGLGFAADIGILFPIINDKLSIGLSVLNLGPKLKIGDVKNKLPMNFRAGVGYKPINDLILAMDVEKPIDADNKFHIGAEYEYNSLLFVRVGYQTIKDLSNAGLTAGAGIKSELGKGRSRFTRRTAAAKRDLVTFCLDYAYVSYGDFDATHRITVGLKF